MMTMYFDPLYLMMLLPCMAISGLCTLWVKSAFSKWSKVGARRGITGAQVAQQILQTEGIHDVRVEPVQGFLSDHYDPRSKTLRLSPENFHGRSIAALGIAAHETGHAIQHARAYPFLAFRSKMVPVATIGSQFSWVLIFLGIFLHATGLTLVGIGLFSIAVLFTLITLPVEFDASNRALLALEHGQILDTDEMPGARRVLRAAAATYVAAAITAIVTLLYFLIRAGLLGGRREE
jgi:uncharacterized protein